MATLLGVEGYKLLEKYNIPVSHYAVVDDKVHLANVAKQFGFPLVMKAISEKIVHKTEAGAIKIVPNMTAASEAFDSLSKMGYVLVQKYIGGQQVIVGAKADETFGKVVLFGGGGIFVEVLKDVSFRVCPITEKDAKEMIDEVKAAKVLKGFRGEKPVNIKAIQDILIKVCRLAEKENIQELDLNPIIVNSGMAAAVDVRIIV